MRLYYGVITAGIIHRYFRHRTRPPANSLYYLSQAADSKTSRPSDVALGSPSYLALTLGSQTNTLATTNDSPCDIGSLNC